MTVGAPRTFGAQLKALRQAAGYTQEELATIAGLSVHAISALERGQRRRPQVETVRALSAALDLAGSSRDAFVGSARAPARAAAIDELTRVSLPLPLTPLLGRDADVQMLRHWLADPSVRFITLTGPGGVGKTRLALELARAIAEEGATRVAFVSLAPVRDAGFVAAAIAEALGLADVTAVDLPRRARAACHDQSRLLVVDNFEQVLDAAPLIADLLAWVAPLRVLVTSRAPLHVRGEREYAVGPLALESDSESMAPADPALAPAVQLFVERVREVQPDFRLTSENAPTVTAICRRLDALPLALELAAPWMKVLTVENLLRRLTHDVLFSTVGARDLPERQRTMNATVAWSYGLLAPDEQCAFRRFGALPGLFPLDAASAVLAGGDSRVESIDEALAATAALIDKSLLVRAENSGVATCPLYQMLETVRAYAALELIAAGERDDAMEGLVRYATAEASQAAEGLRGLSQIEWLDRTREDLESYRGAMTWLIDRGRSAEASSIAWSLFFFWVIRGHAAEGLRWYQQILHGPSLPPSVEAKMLLGAGAMLYTRAELAQARAALTRALALANDTGNMEMEMALTQNLLGHVEYAGGNIDAASERFGQAVERFRALALPWGLGNSLTGMAAVVLTTGESAHAERLLDEATSVLRHTGPWFMALTLNVRAILAVRRGHASGAIAVVRESLAHVRELHDKFAFVYALVPLAAAAVLEGDDAWAARILGARDAVTERTGATVVDKSLDDLREQAERDVRARLGPARWARAYAAGRSISIDALLRDIDGVLRRGTPAG
ncbi:MAG TPA: helix-turn-helix domain-containing protein [Vicinamibacterales bacterium]|nr:helix-turn-helix domain-containing protein [Vicinamibacterales bacterium]